MVADTGLWLRPVQYERTARAAGNAIIIYIRFWFACEEIASFLAMTHGGIRIKYCGILFTDWSIYP
jgi:hypothetical protein